MASKTGGMLQDQNLNIRFNEASLGWKTDVSKAPSKRGAALAGRTPFGAKTDVSKAPSGRGAALAGRTPLGAKTDVSKAPSKRGAALPGRTPLGDLSNALKPSMNCATRKQSSTLFSPLIKKEAVTSGIALDATKKKNTSKASLKQQLAGREELFDITPERLRHNLEECIMDMNEWLQMYGLFDGEQNSPLGTLSASFRKEAVKHKDSPPAIAPEPSARLRRDYDDWIDSMRDNSDSPPIFPEHSERWFDDWIDYSDHAEYAWNWGSIVDRDGYSDIKLKSPQSC